MKLPKKRIKEIAIPNDSDKASIVIKNLSMEEVASIESKFMKITDKGMVMDSYADRTATFAKACLEGWSGFKDEKDMPLKFNPSNIDMASALVIVEGEERTRFFEWIDQQRVKFAEELIEEESKASKNSKS